MKFKKRKFIDIYNSNNASFLYFKYKNRIVFSVDQVNKLIK